MCRALRTAGILSVGGIFALARAVTRSGLNLSTLAHVAGARFGGRIALVDPAGATSFRQLAREADRMAAALRDLHGVRPGSRIGILCRNDASFVRALFATARLGADTYLLNADLGSPQLHEIAARHGLKLAIADTESAARLEGGLLRTILAEAVFAQAPAGHARLRRQRGGQLIVLTGGTTGTPRAAARAPAPSRYLAIFLDLIATLQLDRRDALFLAVPLSHGFGVASLIVALALGRTVHLMPRFDAKEMCRCMDQHDIDALAVVPTTLQRLLAEDGLASLRLIICGGSALPPTILSHANARFGNIVFNLYGSSEAGLISIATPADLAVMPDTVGRAFRGVRVIIGDEDGDPVTPGETGRVIVTGSASARHGPIDTGDIGYQSQHGRLFLRGRGDDMISSGGEKVHPWEVERVFIRHDGVAQVAVIGVDDVDFGQRLVAFVVPVTEGALTPSALAGWLAGRVGRFQQPRQIFFRHTLPLTAAGKPDKRALRATLP